MKKQELLQKIDNELVEKLYGFCYARTNDSYEAQDLCSDTPQKPKKLQAFRVRFTNSHGSFPCVC